ncbi:unnamed protein product [Prunus armeniaca]
MCSPRFVSTPEMEGQSSQLPCVHPFCVYSYDGRAKFPTALRTIDWSTSQLSLVCERATASNEQSSRLSLEWITCAPSY